MSRSDAAPGNLAEFLSRKRANRIAVCIPAREEAATIEDTVAMCYSLMRSGAIDELVVIDDHSTDETATIAVKAGAQVVANPGNPGKGEALEYGVSFTDSEILVFLDGDVTNTSTSFVLSVAEPLLLSPTVQLSKGAYSRTMNGQHGEGGRVTELLARPLLERFFPALADINQPLAGETAVRRSALSEIKLEARYGIEIGLLIDVYLRYGRNAIVDCDLGERSHRNRPISELAGQARDVLDAVIARVNVK